MPLRVISAVMFYPRGGSAHATRAIVQGLRREGCSVTLLSGSRGGLGGHGDARRFYGEPGLRPVDFDPALASPDPTRFQGPPGTAPLHPSYEDRPGAPDRVFAAVDDVAYELQVAAWARELARAGAARADVLYLHHLTPINEAAVRVAPHVPIVGQLHGTELLMLEQIDAGPPPGWTYAERWAWRLRSWAHGCAQLVVTPGGAERAQSLLEVPSSRLVTLPAGVDTELFRPRPVDRRAVWRRALVGEPQGWLPGQPAGSARYSDGDVERLLDGPVLLYAGRFTAVKRVGLLIEAFGAARKQVGRPASLVLVGGHPGEFEGEHPHHAAGRLGVRDLLLAGWHDQRELPDLLCAADAIVLASAREQFGQVLVEGMACGLPAVATRSPGPASIIEPGVTGWLSDGDPTALASTLAEVIANAAERGRRGRAARLKAFENYSWPGICRALDATLTTTARGTEPAHVAEGRVLGT